MGHDNNIVCWDCGVSYACGYGSYSNTVLAASVAEFDNHMTAHGTWRDMKASRNLAHYIALKLHDGHDVQQWSYDWLIDSDDILSRLAQCDEVDMAAVVGRVWPVADSLGVAGLQAYAVKIDKVMVDKGPTPEAEAYQMAIRVALESRHG
jgi:hypothetical protein